MPKKGGKGISPKGKLQHGERGKHVPGWEEGLEGPCSRALRLKEGMEPVETEKKKKQLQRLKHKSCPIAGVELESEEGNIIIKE